MSLPIPKVIHYNPGMAPWLENRLKVIRLILPNPVLLALLGLLQFGQLLLWYLPPTKLSPSLLALSHQVPWYLWTMAWLTLFWLSTLEYALNRKEVFDQTSQAFFKAYLNAVIQQGHGLFHHSEEQDFRSQLAEWHRQVVQGIAIGLGSKAAEDFFQKTDFQMTVSGKDNAGLVPYTGEILRQKLRQDLEELDLIRASLADAHEDAPENLTPPEDLKRISGIKY